jgi:hypothetical protein
MDWVDRLRQAVDAKGKHSVVAIDAGIHPSSLSEILNRASSPQFETIIDLCRVCEVSVGWILNEHGFELGDADYEQITAINDWTAQKLEERNARNLVKSRRQVASGLSPSGSGDAARGDVDGSRRDQRSRHSARTSCNTRARHSRNGWVIASSPTRPLLNCARRPSQNGKARSVWR